MSIFGFIIGATLTAFGAFIIGDDVTVMAICGGITGIIANFYG